MDYKNTVFLPKTDFPMKANLAEREATYLERWEKLDLYKAIRAKSQGQQKFVLHFGPPYANGHIHIGHALSEVLKDVLNKIKQMKGFDAPLVPGWDCHGLPIEWQIEKQYQAKGQSKDGVDPIEFRKECRAFAAQWVGIQKEEFKRLGIVADWDNPYSTMDFASEAAIVAELGKFLMNGTLYRGLKPVMWSVVEKTALAEAEVEYKDKESDAIFVAFPIIKSDVLDLRPVSSDKLEKCVKAIIWTTTPWSLPGNRAIAYTHCDYDVVEIDAEDKPNLHGQKFLIAHDLVQTTLQTLCIEKYTRITTLRGELLSSTIAHHPLHHLGYTFNVHFYYGEHVTTDAGTGLVHTAPSHGIEDFVLGQKHHLPVPDTVGADGVYTHEAPGFEGVHVYKANTPILEALKTVGALVNHTKLLHSYPHSWRSKAPLIYRAAQQWFIDVKKIRDKALKAIAETRFVPEQGRSRIQSMVENRPDWCISRQRAWGTPLTLFVHKKTHELLRDASVHERIVRKIEQEGADAWFTTPAHEFLGDAYTPDDYEQIMDVIDVWLDSGCTNAFVLEQRPELHWPADVYLEGSDQHRGWFQSSLLHGVGTRERAPYNEVVTHGFVLDEKGYKMSKSQGNVVAPEDVIKTYGADILRLWVACIDYADDVRIGKDILKQLEDIYRRFRNTLRYLLGALTDFQDTEKLPYTEMPELEQYILHRVWELQQKMNTTSQSYDFGAFYTELHTFCATDLSAFYFDIRKDSLYCDTSISPKRRAVRTVMDILFTRLTRWLAPVLSFTTEEAYLFRYPKAQDSIHMHTFLAIPDDYHNEKLAEKWGLIRNYRRIMTGALEKERASKNIGSSLQGSLTLFTSPEVKNLFKDIDLAELSITSHAFLSLDPAPSSAFRLEDIHDMVAIVKKAEGGKCERCWRVLEEVKEESVVCKRCKNAVDFS